MGKIRSSNQAAVPCANRVDPAVDAMLVNWGRWAAGRSTGSGCAGVWRLAGRGERSAAYSMGTTTTTMVDTQQACRVEACVCSPAFSPRMRALLQAHYVGNRPAQVTCRDLGLHRDTYDEWVWRATVFFANRWCVQYGEIAPLSLTRA